jgi:spore coat protein JA
LYIHAGFPIVIACIFSSSITDGEEQTFLLLKLRGGELDALTCDRNDCHTQIDDFYLRESGDCPTPGMGNCHRVVVVSQRPIPKEVPALYSQYRVYYPYVSPFDPCPPQRVKTYVVPPQLFIHFQPPNLPQFSPREALFHGTLWPELYSPYEGRGDRSEGRRKK